jgi:hypothetical protein
MRRMQRIGLIVLGALNLLYRSKNNLLWVARGQFLAQGAIGRIRRIRHIRVEPLNLDGSLTVPST